MTPTPKSTPLLVQVSWFLLAVSSLTLVIFVAGYWATKVDEAYQAGMAAGKAECPAVMQP